MSTVRKTIAAGLAIATLSLGVAASATPAAAWGYHPWGWGGGWGPGWGVGAAAAGVALGAAAAATAAPYYAPACGFARQPVVDGYGNIVAYRRIRVCN
ncbi:hypothetical protein [Methylocella sp.]|jgi:hypothetical protein|uniref:hypothetical protein n=1 Tax=Methylocella sp. TaxID=1978226 RepID=UPI003C260815